MTKQYGFESFGYCRKNLVRIAVMTLLCCLPALSIFSQKSESGKLFENQGVTLYYEIRGAKSGTPLFVLNGGPGFDHTYMHSGSAFDKLAKDRPVVFYDQRGVGKSFALKDGESCTFDDQVADLEALRYALGYERIDLLGHSYGGILAMTYAARYPNRISHLILCDSTAPKPSETIVLFEQVFPETSERMQAIKLTDEASRLALVKDYLSMIFYSPKKRDDYLAGVTSTSLKPEINEAIDKDLRKLDITPELAKFRFPTLVITGRLDMNIAPLVAYKIHKAIPNSRYVVFERSGHLPFYEEPKEFVQKVKEFLSVNKYGGN